MEPSVRRGLRAKKEGRNSLPLYKKHAQEACCVNWRARILAFRDSEEPQKLRRQETKQIAWPHGYRAFASSSAKAL